MEMLSKLITKTEAGLPAISFSDSFIKFAVLIAVVLVASFVINFLLSHSFLGVSYRIFVAPGIILHELSHALMCLVTGAKMTHISFFDKEGGRVDHGPSKVPIIGQVMISLAPFVFGAIVIYFLSRRLGIAGFNLAQMDIAKEGLFEFFKSALSGVNIHDYKNLIIVYLVLSIAVTMTPSLQDIRNIVLSVLSILLILFLVLKFTNFHLNAIEIPNEVFVLFSTVVILLILSLALSIIVYIVSKLIKPV